MSTPSQAVTVDFLKQFLREIRKLIDSLAIDKDRLPNWTSGSCVQFGWINETLVAVFDDSLHRDVFHYRGQVDSDVVIFFGVENFVPFSKGATLGKSMLLRGDYTGIGTVKIDLKDEYPQFYECSTHSGYHGWRIVRNIFLLHTPPSSFDSNPIATRFVAFALYVHKNDVEQFEILWEKLKSRLESELSEIASSPEGDLYEKLNKRFPTIELTKTNNVIVLGKDSSPADLSILQQVRDELKSRGYNAELIKELPDITPMSNEEKVRLWSMLSRFCIMVDDRPSGNIAEYVYLREQRTLMAFLRPKNRGSTYMIGDDDIDSKQIKSFRYDETPVRIMNDVIAWCERRVKERQAFFERINPK